MEKQIKNYVPYYFGQEYWIENSGGVYQKYVVDGIKPKFDEHKKITVNQLLLTPVIDESDALSEPSCSFWEWPDKGKFALRPLSDMTEEHLLEVMTMCYIDVYGLEPEFTHTEKVSREEGGGFIAVEDDWRYGLTVTNGGINFSAKGNFLHHNPFEIVRKLYEWGYDLHGLIDSGLAIDKTTINQQ